MHSSLIQQLLHPDLTAVELDHALTMAKEVNIGGLCLPPFWIKKARRDLQETDISLIAAIGYPHGYQMTESKIQQIELALHQGSDELMIAVNLSAFKSGMSWVKIELAKCAHIIHQASRIMTVMLNLDFLDKREIQELVSICKDAGTDQINLMAAHCNPSQIQEIRQWIPQSMGTGVSGMEMIWEDYQFLLQQGIEQIMGKNVLRVIQDYRTA
ncbi:MAG: hypothetical protein OER04_02190 [Cyclobacteriaceae bacterium]|nr:hypothetical protein [Cyclobacteriaceae bacterium]